MRPAIRFRVVEREALRQKISINQSTVSPLTLLLAPAGHGKTVAALAELNRNLYIGVFSRRFAAFDGPMVTSRIGTATISVDDLTFTRDEVERLSWLYGVTEPETIDETHRATGGWAFTAAIAGDYPQTQRYLERRAAHEQRTGRQRGRQIGLIE